MVPTDVVSQCIHLRNLSNLIIFVNWIDQYCAWKHTSPRAGKPKLQNRPTRYKPTVRHIFALLWLCSLNLVLLFYRYYYKYALRDTDSGRWKYTFGESVLVHFVCGTHFTFSLWHRSRTNALREDWANPRNIFHSMEDGQWTNSASELFDALCLMNRHRMDYAQVHAQKYVLTRMSEMRDWFS